jgi:8-oxo-dGTP diphosphatase
MQAGEEILRTKPAKKGRFDHNSYRSSDRVNSLKWEDLDKPQYQTTLEYYRGLIAFRKAHPCLRLQTREQVDKAVQPITYPNPHAIGFRIEDRSKELFILFNADTRDVTAPLPQGNWDIHVLGDAAGTVSLGKAADSIQVPAISTLVLSRKKPVDVVAALIWEKDKFLICQRPPDKTRGLLWEFVGGKTEPGETLEQALIRECAEELAITVEVGKTFMEVIHDYPDMLIRLTLFHCTIPTGQPQALEHNDIRWIHPSQTDDFTFCPADIDILKEIKRQYEKRQPL